jgi:hypothetical protein
MSNSTKNPPVGSPKARRGELFKCVVARGRTVEAGTGERVVADLTAED